MEGKNTFYRTVSDDNGEHYYCPLDTVTARELLSENIPDGCVEASVVGRYAGTIQLADRPQP